MEEFIIADVRITYYCWVSIRVAQLFLVDRPLKRCQIDSDSTKHNSSNSGSLSLMVVRPPPKGRMLDKVDNTNQFTILK